MLSDVVKNAYNKLFEHYNVGGNVDAVPTLMVAGIFVPKDDDSTWGEPHATGKSLPAGALLVRCTFAADENLFNYATLGPTLELKCGDVSFGSVNLTDGQSEMSVGAGSFVQRLETGGAITITPDGDPLQMGGGFTGGRVRFFMQWYLQHDTTAS